MIFRLGTGSEYTIWYDSAILANTLVTCAISAANPVMMQKHLGDSSLHRDDEILLEGESFNIKPFLSTDLPNDGRASSFDVEPVCD